MVRVAGARVVAKRVASARGAAVTVKATEVAARAAAVEMRRRWTCPDMSNRNVGPTWDQLGTNLGPTWSQKSTLMEIYSFLFFLFLQITGASGLRSNGALSAR